MALSYNVHNKGSGWTTATLSFTFDYIDTADIKAAGLNSSDNYIQLTVNSVDTTAKTVTLSAIPDADYSKVRIYRATSSAALVDFVNSTALTENDLDTAYRQGLFAAQEVSENASGSDQRTSTGTDDISDTAITTAKIADGAVTQAKIEDPIDLSSHSVTLATGEIGTSEIADDAVTNDKLADDAVDSDQIADGSVDNVHLSGSIDLTTKVTGVLPAANGGTGVSTAIPFTQAYTSDVSYPAVDTETSAAHGLGGVPKLFQAQFVCTTANNGYSIGDVVNLGDSALNSTHPIATVHADGTNIYFTRGADIEIIGKGASDDVEVTVTSANFDVRLSAYV